MPIEDISKPPQFCQYAAGPCDQLFDGIDRTGAVVLYPSEPPQIAATIEGAVDLLAAAGNSYLTWRNFRTAGQVVFCSICRRMRFSGLVIADVTTLNFNLMFEIGFALGLELPLLLVRDTSYIRHTREFEELGLLDTVGYVDFKNSEELATSIQRALPVTTIPAPKTSISPDPVYVIKDHLGNEGQVRLLSTIRKSPLRFRAYDPIEDPRLTLHEARRQVGASVGVLGHILASERRGSLVHNARTALIAGIAVASKRLVVLLEEGKSTQPIDYRDIVSPYLTPDQIQGKLERFIRAVTVALQDTTDVEKRPADGLLERIDLGDVAAENEVRQLKSYFVPTGQFNDAKRGYARLVVGRKGSGKTAIFFAIRNAVPKSPSHLIVDMSPEGHQFTRMREAILQELSPGLQDYTLTAFWNYVLLCEIAAAILDNDYSWAQRDHDRFERFEALRDVYAAQNIEENTDFPERLLRQIERLVLRFEGAGRPKVLKDLTPALFSGDIPRLDKAVADYLRDKKQVWLLIDNLDKGWPTRGASSADILLIRTLLEALRKLQRQLSERDVEFHALAFIRNDIYEHLVRDTPDKDKDTAIAIDWDDTALFKEIVRQRLLMNPELSGDFEVLWRSLFDARVGTEESFGYAVDRTLMRPRDLLKFLHRAVEFAVNRGHNKVLEDDFVSADRVNSEDLLMSVNFEIGDVAPRFRDILYYFIGCTTKLTESAVRSLLAGAGLDDPSTTEALELLIWIGFLGVQTPRSDVQFAYQVHYNLTKLLSVLHSDGGVLIVHPAFRTALGCA